MSQTLLIFCFFALFQITLKTPDDFKWKNRLIIVRDVKVSIDSLLLENKKAITDRKLIIISFENDKLECNSSNFSIDPEKFIQLFKSQDLSTKWLLLGLDGGIKKIGTEDDFQIDKFFETIDQMPMRESELRLKNRLFQ
jgi:hypothetical protein